MLFADCSPITYIISEIISANVPYLHHKPKWSSGRCVLSDESVYTYVLTQHSDEEAFPFFESTPSDTRMKQLIPCNYCDGEN